MPYLSASAVVIHYEEALYQVYVHLPSTYLTGLTWMLEFSELCKGLCKGYCSARDFTMVYWRQTADEKLGK